MIPVVTVCVNPEFCFLKVRVNSFDENSLNLCIVFSLVFDAKDSEMEGSLHYSKE